MLSLLLLLFLFTLYRSHKCVYSGEGKVRGKLLLPRKALPGAILSVAAPAAAPEMMSGGPVLIGINLKRKR